MMDKCIWLELSLTCYENLSNGNKEEDNWWEATYEMREGMVSGEVYIGWKEKKHREQRRKLYVFRYLHFGNESRIIDYKTWEIRIVTKYKRAWYLKCGSFGSKVLTQSRLHSANITDNSKSVVFTINNKLFARICLHVPVRKYRAGL